MSTICPRCRSDLTQTEAVRRTIIAKNKDTTQQKGHYRGQDFVRDDRQPWLGNVSSHDNCAHCSARL